MTSVKVFDYRWGFGLWIGRYAFFKAKGRFLPVIILRSDFQRLGITSRKTGRIITDRDADTPKAYLRQLR